MTFSSDAFTRLYNQAPLLPALPPEAEARGLMVAVCAAPEIPLPETWMPWLIRHESTETRLTDPQVDQLAQALMYCLRDTLDAMRHNAPLLPHNWLEGEKPDEQLVLWLIGLLDGHQRLEPVWQNAWQRAQQQPQKDTGLEGEDPSRRLRRCLKMFSTLADIPAAYTLRTPPQQEQLTQSLPALIKQLPQMLEEYIRLAGELAAFLPNQFEFYEGQLEK